MAKRLQLRGGTTAQHNVFTGAVREVTVDTDKDTLVVHDGATAGGFALAKESSVSAHTNRTDNPHSVTKAQVGLGNAEDTADANKVVFSASKLTTARTITIAGDASGSANFDGSADATITIAVANDSHAHAFANITSKPTTLAGYGITDADTSAQVTTKINNAVAGLVASAPTALDTLNEFALALGNDANFATTTSTALGNRVIKNADIVAGTATKVTYDSKGLVTGGTNPTTLVGYGITDAVTKVTSTDDAIVRFDGTTGQVQNSAITIDDSGNIGSGTQSFNGFGGSGFKNHIINGNFNVWQRGTSFTGLTNGTYSSDRWVVYDAAGDINYNVVRNAGVFNAGYGATYSFNSGTAARSVIQFIENVTRFKVGSNVTISFEAYTNSTPYTVAVAIQGVKGVWASATGEVTSNIALTNTKTKYSVTLPIPDWTSLGIDWAHLEDTKLALKFNLGVETNGRDFILGSVQLEDGSVATPFENRPYGLELSMCQRYFFIGGTASSGVFVSASTARFNVKLPCEMRVSPSVTPILAPIILNSTVSEAQTGSQTLNFGVTGYAASVRHAVGQIQFDGFSSGVDGRPTVLLNDALSFSAEL